MNGGVIVAVCVVATLVVSESVLPRIYAFLVRRWNAARAARREAEENKAKAEGEGETQAKAAEGAKVRVGGERRDLQTASAERTGREGGSEADRLWAEARGMVHGEIPDFSTDWQYMTLLHKAAKLGHVEAMSVLGDHAFARGDSVEAFYWKLGVELCGGICRNPSLADIVREWTADGCPDGSEETGAGFTEQQRAFAYSVLCLRSGVDPQFARVRLKELAEQGCDEARLYLGRK